MNRLTRELTIDGTVVTIRPIKNTDSELEAEFIRNLSPKSKHYRFLGGVSELTTKDLERLTYVDGKNSMAFVATVDKEGQETVIGVSRFAAGSTPDSRETAVTVTDRWQKHGVGMLLMRMLIEFAKKQGVKRLFSVDFTENTSMSHLAADLGMKSTLDINDATQTVYSMKL